MRKTLEDLYYGNITPCEQQMVHDSELKRAVDRTDGCEEQLLALLDEKSQHILLRLTRSQHEVNSITATKSFILGFRLGVRMMAECMDGNDCDIQTGGE